MTQLFNPPVEVGMYLSVEGAPHLLAGPWHGKLEPVARWMAELDWWRQPIAREYWKVLFQDMPGSPEDSLLCEVFHDLYLDVWFLERVYD